MEIDQEVEQHVLLLSLAQVTVTWLIVLTWANRRRHLETCESPAATA